MTPIFTQINELQNKIKKLSKGSISRKTINGTEKFYLQWFENGVEKSTYLKDKDTINALQQEIEQRELYENEIFHLKFSDIYRQQNLLLEEDLPSFVLTPIEVEQRVQKVKNFEKRDCYKELDYFMNTQLDNRLCILNGLRRTGKTTLIFQYLLNMNDEDYSHSAYLLMRKDENNSSPYTLDELIVAIRKLQQLDFKYIFIDEITLVKDFINNAHLISDVHCCAGNKIVLSGTDSLGFWIANGGSLYDRNLMIHMTYISYAEHSRLLGTNDIDNYIKYGGTLTLNKNYNNKPLETLSFSSTIENEKYINTAICNNIQNSLRLYYNTSEFPYINELYKNDELINAIKSVIEGLSRRFILDVIIRDFKSKELYSNSDLFTKSSIKEEPIDFLKENDKTVVTKITQRHLEQIKDFLKHLDLVVDLEIVKVNPKTYIREYENYDLITQPGLRYSQVINLIDNLKKDDKFASLPSEIKNVSIDKIKKDVLGRLLEDIVLLDCKHKLMYERNFDIFQINFGQAEFDMVIYDHTSYDRGKCYLYEIKHSDKIVDSQASHLCNPDLLDFMTEKYGTIMKRCILYRGENFTRDDGIEYKNVCEFLKEDLHL